MCSATTTATTAAAAPTAVAKRMEKNVLTVKPVDGVIMYMHIVTKKARYKTEIFKWKIQMKINMRLSSTLTFIQTVYAFIHCAVECMCALRKLPCRPIFHFGLCVSSSNIQHPCVLQMLCAHCALLRIRNINGKNVKLFIVNSANNLMCICWFDRRSLLIYLFIFVLIPYFCADLRYLLFYCLADLKVVSNPL